MREGGRRMSKAFLCRITCCGVFKAGSADEISKKRLNVTLNSSRLT